MEQVKQLPWAVRIKRASANAENTSKMTAQPCQRFLQEPVPSVMLGAALVSGQPCLLWNAQNLLTEVIKDDDIRLQTSSWTLLEALRKKILSHNEERAGYTLLFRFLVEPFALMYRSSTFYPVGGAPQSTNQRL